jgi:hypothetical protein
MKNLALISLALVSAGAFAKPTTFIGWIGDQKCGVKCASASHQACAVSCLKGGGTYIFVLDKDKTTIYTYDSTKLLVGHEGQLVKIEGTLNGTVLHVDKVKEYKPPTSTGGTGTSTGTSTGK